MRSLMLLALPLLFAACDSKPAEPAHPMHDAAPTAAGDKAKDPICGMFVDKAKAIKHTHEGADYYFCADNCLTKFKADPKKYAAHCTCPNTKRTCSCDHCGGKEPCDCSK